MRRLPRGSHLKCLTAFCDVRFRTIDAGALQRPVEQFTGRTDEWFAGHIFLVSRLLADQHQLGQR